MRDKTNDSDDRSGSIYICITYMIKQIHSLLMDIEMLHAEDCATLLMVVSLDMFVLNEMISIVTHSHSVATSRHIWYT